MNLSDWRGEDWRSSNDCFNKDAIIGVERDHGLALEYDIDSFYMFSTQGLESLS